MKYAIEQSLSNMCYSKILPRILYYHSVHPEAPLSHRPQAFASQIEWLRVTGYELCTLADAAKRLLKGELAQKTAVITFDDGYEDNLRFALPILSREGVQATFFVVSGMIGNSPMESVKGHKLYPGLRMMTRNQLRELAGVGMEIGSHTRSHIHVLKTLKQSASAVFEELSGSRADLEDILGKPVQSFAYPNGQKGVFSRRTRDALAQAGYQYATTTMWGGLTPADDPLQLPRIEIRHTDSLEVFTRKMKGQYDFMSLYCRLVARSSRW